ncbi:MAG: 2-oxoacid:acceptor oxidoreductase family protein [Planctomycetota bacterium]|jgi:pyruvate-ferredoxin/flavodoxin oxidoreductase
MFKTTPAARSTTHPRFAPADIRHPGIATTADGAAAVAWVETNICQGACAYPITSSTTMGTGFETAVANGYENLWGEPLMFLEPESEHSSASACEGFAVAGGRVANFTSGQGLVLMKEVLYTISGKRLPVVFHIGARALTSHSLNVHAGHDDCMAVADCGWGMLFGRNAQEAGDLALIARRAAEAADTPFLNIQDGFLTTHTIENVLLPEKEFMKEFVGDPRDKLTNMMDPKNPVMSGVVQNQDSYMKGKVAQRMFYDRVAPALQEAFHAFAAATGRAYDLIDTYRMADAEYAFVGMGSYMETAKATVDWLRRERGMRFGLVTVISYQPFPAAEIVRALKDVEAFAVLERMDDPLAPANPLTLRIKAAFTDALLGLDGFPHLHRLPRITTGIGGLGSRDVRPGDWVAVADNLQAAPESQRHFFSLGIKHETALVSTVDPDVRPPGSFSMRGHSVGGYGSVTTNKVIASLVADIFDLHVQAYPKYGSEKKGLPTTYCLTVAEAPILTHCELRHVEFLPLNDVNAFNLSNPLQGLAGDGSLFIQSAEADPAEVWASIPKWGRQKLLEQNARVFFLDTVAIAKETTSSLDLVQRMQGIVLLGIFLKVTPFLKRRQIDDEQLLAGVERSLRKYFGSRGEQVVQDNLTCARRGFREVQEIPRAIMKVGGAR